MHHLEVDTDRLHVKGKEEEEGRRLLQIEVTYKAEVASISEYLNKKM